MLSRASDNYRKSVYQVKMGLPESVLIMVPTSQVSSPTFPALGLQGNGYSTGKQIFEAENQAEVSGAWGLKILIMFDKLVRRACSLDKTTPRRHKHRIVFSICMEGPHHELWAHYIIVKDGRHHFNMVLLDICDGNLLKQAESFSSCPCLLRTTS